MIVNFSFFHTVPYLPRTNNAKKTTSWSISLLQFDICPFCRIRLHSLTKLEIFRYYKIKFKLNELRNFYSHQPKTLAFLVKKGFLPVGQVVTLFPAPISAGF